jgi:hypothetical protein
MPTILVKMRDASGDEWYATGVLALDLLSVNNSDQHSTLPAIEAMGKVQIVEIKVIRD